MRFFFRSRQFKIILLITVILIIISAVCAVIGSRMSPQSDIAGTLTAPFRSAVTKISNTVADFVSDYSDGEKLRLQNADLEAEINELRQKLADYEKMTEENEFYKNYLKIKDDNKSFKFAPATLISRDNSDIYLSFTVNKGSLSDIAVHDPVITDAGLVGYISEVGLTTSKVTTILSAELTAGALDNRTNDSGIISGTPELSLKGETRFRNLSRSSSIAVGDYAVTSGEGIFPPGLLIGAITAIGSDKYNTSIYADVKPFVDFSDLRSVMVITEFEGQGGIVPQGD